MEDFPGSLPDAKPNDNQDRKKKRRNKSANLPLPRIASLENEQKNKPAKPENTRLDDALANLLIERRDTSVKPDKAKDQNEDTAAVAETQPESQRRSEAEAGQPAVIPEHPDSIGQTAEKDESAEDDGSDEDYEELQSYEAAPVEFSGGEVIIHLQGDTPVAERVIPLEAEDQTDTEAEQPEPVAVEAPIYTRQPEQQHQARSYESVPEAVAAAGGGGEVPPVPPEASAPSFEPPLQPPEFLQPRPEDIYSAPISAPNIAANTSSGEKLATKQELDDAVYYATKAGQRRGLLTGLLVGGAYEHFKHKRREKRQEKRFQKQGKELEAARQDYNFGLQEQTRQQSESVRQLHSAEQRLDGAGKRFENRPQPEKLLAAPLPQPELEAGQLAIPADHRIEASAWHSIEIDSKTGRPVENPAFQYGHEYYRERAQEATPAPQRNAAAGEVALVAAAAGSGGSSPASDNPQGAPPQIPDATTQGPPSTSQALRDIPAVEPGKSSSGPLWPWLVALAVIVICLAALLR